MQKINRPSTVPLKLDYRSFDEVVSGNKHDKSKQKMAPAAITQLELRFLRELFRQAYRMSKNMAMRAPKAGVEKGEFTLNLQKALEYRSVFGPMVETVRKLPTTARNKPLTRRKD